tara:strand:- start:951 stop:2276 length:1326 start_codon:yes stop_codon:yes gene_type:complete
MNRIITIAFCSLFTISAAAQSIDKIKAIIGDEIVLMSEIETQYLQYISQGDINSNNLKCDVIEELLLQKLMINQAKIDSIYISDDEVDSEITKRMYYFESQLGSIEKVEEYFGKNKIDIKRELYKVIKDQFLAQKIQSNIYSGTKVTPAEVREFFNNQRSYDIPKVPTKSEIIQIIIKPEISDNEEEKVREKLNGFRERVYNGEDFKVLATLYSDDLESAKKGGELGYVNRGDLVPEFERAAFKLKEGEISEVVKSEFGFHIIQLINRRGEQINARHILLRTKVSSTSMFEAKNKIDNIRKEIENGNISFEDAVSKYSNDKNKKNGGLLLDPNTMTSLLIENDLPTKLKYTVQRLSVNDVSSPVLIDTPDGKQAYCLLKLNKRIKEHTANLIDDFSIIKEIALNAKKQDKLLYWVENKIDKTYIQINNEIKNCSFKNKWIN